MSNWLRILCRLDLASNVLPVLVIAILYFPIIGSRSIGGSLGNGKVQGSDGVVVTYDPPLGRGPGSALNNANKEESTISSGGGGIIGDSESSGSGLESTTTISNPCALVSMSLLDGKDGKLMTFEEKSLLTVSHPIFDVSHGIVPNILYKVDVEIPPGHEFSLEYWMNGLPEERARLKRRHQRDHRDVLELYLNSSSEGSMADQVIFCSKSSLGGQNKDSSYQVLSFYWFVNGNTIAISPNGLPASIVFRLRLKSIVEETTSVFDQNLSVVVRSDCYLVMQVVDENQLKLSALLNPLADNKGLNCTVFILPKATFGLEIRIANFSIYGMRDICKGRYITFTQPKKHNSNFEDHKDTSNEFPTHQQLSSLERKFCGKMEDYTIDERLLTFASESSLSQTSSSASEKVNTIPLWSSTDALNANPYGVLLQVNLPVSVKGREAFTLELSSLSPCQRVVLKDLDGELKYSKNYENDECSIVIHVPYGNTIMTKLTLSRDGKSPGVTGDSSTTETEEETQGEPESNSINEESDNNRSSNNNSINYYNYNDSDLEFESGESIDNSIPTTSYECPINLDVKTSSSDGGGSGDDEDNENTTAEKYFIITAIDLVSGSEFKWCFDGSSKSQALHKRAWKSSGNTVKISFKLKYFNIFHLAYQSVKIPEITKECERGWVSMEDGCVTLVESSSSWTSAEESCQFKGGHLATINSEAVEQHVQKIITKSALFHPSRAYWIGANDRESEMGFSWASGLPFSYNNWFMGWTHKRNEIVNAQPNDDGWSGQDCVEIRQIFAPSSTNVDKPLSSLFLGASHSGNTQVHNIWPHSRFYWNDRNCEVKNFYLCERGTQKNIDLSCNRTLKLDPLQAASLTVTSPAYPSSYPDNIVCVTTIESVPGYRIVLSFEEFVFEESTNCQYDALELLEIQQEGNISSIGGHENRTGSAIKSKRICGDWSKRLKLLRYTTSKSTTALKLKFESDFSHHFGGYKAHVWVEKDVSEQCTDPHMKKFGSHCYLSVSFPAVNWVTAQQICTSLQGKLASILSPLEWNFLTRSIKSNSDYNKKYTFWIGGSIDQNSQLGWSDRMPFNFSAFHQSDLQTISDWKCLTVYWHSGGKGDLAWRLADCNQLSGYICKKKAEGEIPESVNKTSTGNGGKQNSPNYPKDYYNNLDHTYHLVAPRGTQIVIRFTHLDVEEQEDCLYDFVEIIDRHTKNSTRFCGTHPSNELNKLDYVSSSNEVDVHFHTDFSDTQTGFEIVWRAVDVTSCLSGKTILTGSAGNGFPIHDATFYTPNFPHFNLPHLNCIYTIVAPAGQRIWLNFQIFELGVSHSGRGQDCLEQDHVSIELGEELRDEETSTALSNENEIILCGNLSASSFRTSFLSHREKMRIRVFSPNGKTGRGFLGRYKAVPGGLIESLTLATEPNKTCALTSLNFPLDPPEIANLTVAISSPPNYVLTVNINGSSNCPKTIRSYLEIRDPYHGTNGTTWRLCRIDEPALNNLKKGIMVVNDNEGGNDNNKIGRNEISQGMTPTVVNSAISFRSTFNRIDVKQVYLPGFRGKKWNAEVVTVLDENFRAKVLADGDRLLKLDGCINNPCANGGKCLETHGGNHICRCPDPYTGPFCGLSLCDLNPCLFGECVLGESSIKCVCQLGYGGDRCDRRMKPCDIDNPCSGHGNCHEINSTSYNCRCFAWYEGPQCESRMLVIPYKPLSQRMIEEPFWLGLITVTVVLGVIGLLWCLKRHSEKLEKLLNEDLDGRNISWVSGRSPSFRAGGGVTLGMREPIPGTSQQAISPPASRSFLGRFGIRKPSLLSLSSATSNVSVTAASPHTYENRTFSLDDLLRPSRSMMRTPSPHRRRNYSVQVRRDPAEKQQILQQLVSAGGSTSLDGESKPSTPKPTLAEIIQMSEKRLRLASASSMQSETGADLSPNKPMEIETSFTTNLTPISQQTKAEKKVTFARMLDKLAATEMSSSSSCSDVSCAEDTKMVVIAPKPLTKKDRKGRFRRSKTSQRGRNSETDQDCMDISSSDTTPDPINPPRFPTRLCISPTNLGNSNFSGATLTAKGVDPKIPKMASADSLLALFRRFSGGSNSAPPSPQYSENEESSTGATPLSTPSSPRNSLLSIKPPALLITTALESNFNNTIELPVIDPFAQTQGCWRAPPATSITLEVPMRDYCLSPIHEVPTPIGTPSHSPCCTPMMKRPSTENLPSIKIQRGSSEDDDGSATTGSSSSSTTKKECPRRKNFAIPMISISVDESDEEQDTNVFFYGSNDEHKERVTANDKRMQYSMTGESEVIPDVLIHVPPDACVESHPEAEDAEILRSPKIKTKPPPLIFANEILSFSTKQSSGDDDRNNKIIVPSLSIEYATPVLECLPEFPSCEKASSFAQRNLKCEVSRNISMIHSKEHPLAPPMITINQTSEAESDSDTPAQRLIHRPNLCFLSPFAGTSDRVPSESNLSTSGYSSMASPCPSRCPSASPLCPSEAEDYHLSSQFQNHPRRSSLTPGTPKKPCLSPRRCSLTTPHLASGLLCDNSERFGLRDTSEIKSKEEIEIETDSAVEVETDLEFLASMSEMENHPSTPTVPNPSISMIPEDMKYINSLLQVPKKGMPKSRSLDINVMYDNGIAIGKNNSDGSLGKRGYLKGLGPSLDSKLNCMDRSTKNTSTGVTIIFPLSSSHSSLSGRNLIEIPEEKERRLSPVSSRSESPLSELSAAGYFGFLGSTLTDSDGVYDCGSSEVPTNNNETDNNTTTASIISLFPLQRLSPKRRSLARRKDRRAMKSSFSMPMNPGNVPMMSEDLNQLSNSYSTWTLSGTSAISPEIKSSLSTRSSSLGQYLSSHLDLPPNLARENLLPSVAGTKRASPKRRARAQPAIDDMSSSSESLSSSRPRSRTSASSAHNSRGPSRNNSPLPISNSVEKVLEIDKSPPLPTTSNTSPESSMQAETSLICRTETDKNTNEGDIPKPIAGRSNELVIPVSTPRKISRLRTISHQIRFLRRLEMSLIRKKECLTQISSGRRDSILSRTDSAEDSSRYDSSDCTSASSDCSSRCSNGLQDNEKPLLSSSSTGGASSSGKRSQRKRKGKVTPLSLFENITSTDFLKSHKKRVKKYK